MRNDPKSLPRTIALSTLRVKRRRLPRSHPMHSQGKTASAMAGYFCASFFLRAKPSKKAVDGVRGQTA